MSQNKEVADKGQADPVVRETDLRDAPPLMSAPIHVDAGATICAVFIWGVWSGVI